VQSEVEVARSLYEKGKFSTAESILRTVEKSEPNNLAALVILAMICVKTGRADEAAELLESAIEREPEQYESLATLAMIRQSKGDPKGAIELATRAISANPAGADGHNALGVALLADGKPTEAVEVLWKAVSINQGSAPARHNLGVALRAMDRGRDAYNQFRIAIQLAPQDPANYQDLYEQIRWLSNWREALPYLELCREFLPGNLDLAELLADAYGRAGQSDRSDQLFRQVLERDPTRGQLFVGWLKDSGRFEEANELLTTVLGHDSTQGWPYYELAEAKVYEVGGHPLAERISRVMGEAELSPRSQMLLTHALALCHEHDGDYEKAMETYVEANNLARSLYVHNHFDEGSEIEKFQRSKDPFNHDSVERLRSQGSTSETPIFVVGMIRSGTTLINQILSSHSNVA
jgi:tetratricopeptide (TPR) repeat protein